MSDRPEPAPLPAATGAATEPVFDSPDVAAPEHVDRGTGSLRVRAARGILINSAFRIGLSAFSLGRNIGIAAFLTAEDYGLWALIMTTMLTIAFLKQIGISSKYIQQNEADQKLAFQKAFSVDLTYTALLYIVVAVALPLYALIYGRPEIIVPGYVLSLAMLISVFQAPIWVYYRRMEYFRQRSLEAIDPVLSAIVMVALAAGFGLGVWALVIGAVAGVAVTSIAAVIFSPYPLRYRYDRGTLREYLGFSWPVFVNGASALVVVQATLITGNAVLGLAALGAIGLAGNFARFSNRVESLINRTLYPPICAAQDRFHVLREVFEKSNRIGLMWAMPFGVALALFTPDLIEFVLGAKWSHAQTVLQVAGLIFALQVFGFSWMNFYMARGDTRPLATFALAQVAFFFAVTLPLMLTVGLDGYVIGIAAAAVLQLLIRTYYLKRLFTDFSMLSHMRRALAPVIPAVAVVLIARALEGDERSLALAAAELTAYWLVVGVATYLGERPLISEAVGYLRKAARRGPVPDQAGAAA